MEECIFCKIINKEIPASIIFEDENIVAFLDISPKSEGHTLVVPKTHYENLMEKKDEVDLIEYIQKITKILQEQYKFKDFKIVINIGEKAGQEVFHTHIHIIPH